MDSRVETGQDAVLRKTCDQICRFVSSNLQLSSSPPILLYGKHRTSDKDVDRDGEGRRGQRNCSRYYLVLLSDVTEC